MGQNFSHKYFCQLCDKPFKYTGYFTPLELYCNNCLSRDLAESRKIYKRFNCTKMCNPIEHTGDLVTNIIAAPQILISNL